MKTIHIAAILGGAAVIYFVTREKAPSSKRSVQIPAPPPSPTKVFDIIKGELILSDPSQLEGYFSTGATPCCYNCAHGRHCAG